ncbi:MAG: exodeoxyribonuclease VII large subunit, partial [Myxococcales bacterium]
MSTLPLFGRDGGREDEGERVYRVAQVNRMVRMVLEERWSGVWIEGELSDVKRAASGHVYFT